MEFINGTLMLTEMHHHIEPDKNVTELEGQLEGYAEPLFVRVEIKRMGQSEDISPVFDMKKAEPLMFALLPHSATCDSAEPQPEDDCAIMEQPQDNAEELREY